MSWVEEYLVSIVGNPIRRARFTYPQSGDPVDVLKFGATRERPVALYVTSVQHGGPGLHRELVVALRPDNDDIAPALGVLRAGTAFRSAQIEHSITLLDEVIPSTGIYSVVLAPPAQVTGLPHRTSIAGIPDLEFLQAVPITAPELEIVRSSGPGTLFEVWTQLTRAWWDPTLIPPSLASSGPD